MEPRAGTGPVSGWEVRETASECEASEGESLDILRKVKQITETWNQRRGEITQAVLSHTKGPMVKSRKVKINASFRMKARRGFTGIELTRRNYVAGLDSTLASCGTKSFLINLSRYYFRSVAC